MSTKIRQPIVTVLGHVDHGKTTLLDCIRETTVAEKEPGQITQSIGSTHVPKSVIEKICGRLLEKFGFDIVVPGLLFIDTPGHEAFITLRKRGGSIADLAVLVIDIMEGLKPQTVESIEILKTDKVPFVVAINKIDKIQGWRSGKIFFENFENQLEITKGIFEEKFYNVIKQLSDFGFDVERFDRVGDFKKTIACVPTSGKSGEGVSELLAVLIGLSQQFLADRLILTDTVRGSILELKELAGFGKTIDVILYDGILRKNDYLIVGGKNPCVTKIKALLLPKPLQDIRTEKKFLSVDECVAACGVKIADNFENVVAGSEIRAGKTLEEAERIFLDFIKEKEEIEIITEKDGLVLKADTIGSLEALINIFKNYPIKEATLGSITKKEIMSAETNSDFNKVIIGFNVHPTDEVKFLAKDKKIKIIESNIIYKLVEDYEKWLKEMEEELERKVIATLTKPCKIRIIPGYVFRASGPAIVGCEVHGSAKPGYKLFKVVKDKLQVIGEIKEIQKEGKTLEEVSDDNVAISILGPVVGRQVKENDILYSDIASDEYKKFERFEKFLTESEKKILKEIFEIKRKADPNFGL